MNGKNPENWRTQTLAEIYTSHGSIPNWQGIRADQYVYVYYSDDDYEFLHDLKKDPDQLVNYAKDEEYKSILEEMRVTLKETLEPLGRPFP